jgi:histidine ammonia-lyase
MKHLTLDGTSLTIEDVVHVSRDGALVEIDPKIKPRLDEVRKYVEQRVKDSTTAHRGTKESAIYGVTTGFGALKGILLQTTKDARQIQENVVISHAAGVGAPLDDEIVRAVMLIRASTLVAGYSGVRYELIDRLVGMLNAGILPVIPEQGSVGASGDLAPLSHLALGLIGLGPVRFDGGVIPALAGFESKKPVLQPFLNKFRLSYKEGLALMNGLAVTAAIGALNVQRARELLLWADAIGSMTAEAVLGAPRAFDEIVFKVYGHEGAKISAANVRRMTAGSELMNGSPDVHDPYSVRCIPQVHGAVRDTLGYAATSIQNHLHTVDDDPIFFTKEETAASTPPVDGWTDRLHYEHGNFHGAPLGYAMDYLGIAMSDLGSISERRIAMLVDKNHNRGLPGFLTYSRSGTTSGVMLAQYVAASIISENKVLSHPASVDNVPTSADTEDHVSMSTLAARKARSILANVESVLAIELLCAALALAYRIGDLPSGEAVAPRRMGEGTRELYKLIKSRFANFREFKERDCVLHDQIEKARQMIRPGAGIKLPIGG